MPVLETIYFGKVPVLEFMLEPVVEGLNIMSAGVVAVSIFA